MGIVDRGKRQTVYQGGVEVIMSSEMLRNSWASLTDAIARVLQGYLFVAGQSVPVAPVDRRK